MAAVAHGNCRLDWPLDTAGAFDDDFCGTVGSESFRAQATGNCIKIMKRTKKRRRRKRDSEREWERGGGRQRESATWNKWSKEINSPIKNNHSEFCWIMHELAVPRPRQRPQQQQQRRILEHNWTSRGVHICEKSARPRLHLPATAPAPLTLAIYFFLQLQSIIWRFIICLLSCVCWIFIRLLSS